MTILPTMPVLTMATFCRSADTVGRLKESSGWLVDM
jgi:hypothetical protein